MEDGMGLHFLSSLWHDTGIEQNGENASIQLIVDLYPFDRGIQSLIHLTLTQFNFDLSERAVEQLFHVLIDE